MCKGIEGENRDGPSESANGICWVSCELCNSTASVYCQADGAFLCRICDNWVHGANFLAGRHIRCLICGACGNLTQRFLIGTPAFGVKLIQRRRTQDHRCENLGRSRCRAVKKPFLFL